MVSAFRRWKHKNDLPHQPNKDNGSVKRYMDWYVCVSAKLYQKTKKPEDNNSRPPATRSNYLLFMSFNWYRLEFFTTVNPN